MVGVRYEFVNFGEWKKSLGAPNWGDRIDCFISADAIQVTRTFGFRASGVGALQLKVSQLYRLRAR